MKKLTFLIVMVCFKLSLYADMKGAVGVAVENTWSVYDGVDTDSRLIPLVFLRHDNYYAQGTRFGVFLYKDCHYRIGSGLSLDFSSIDRNQNRALKEIEDISGRVNINIRAKRIGKYIDIALNLDKDISNRSKGYRITAEVIKPIQFDRIKLSPGIGVVYSDKKTNEYLYTVGSQKAAATYDTYEIKDSFDPFIAVTARYKFSQRLGMIVSAKYTKLSSSITDSPIVQDDTELKARLGLLYYFSIR